MATLAALREGAPSVDLFQQTKYHMFAASQSIEVTVDTSVIELASSRRRRRRQADDPSTEMETEADDDDDEFSAESGSILSADEENGWISSIHGKKLLLEFAYCGLFCALGHVVLAFHHLYWEPNQRPIPSQYLESTSEYVRNLVDDQPNNGETITGLGVALLALIPIATQLAFIAFTRHPTTTSKSQKFIQIQKSLCTYLVAITINNLITDLFKNYVGYLRPIFYWACQPNDNYTQCTTDQPMHHFRTSFPSGHASFSFCIWVLFCIFLEQRFGLSSIERTTVQPQSGGRLIRVYTQPPGWYRFYSIVAAAPMVVAIWVAASRLADNWHFPADVVGGACLGSVIAVGTHRVWFPDPRMQKIIVV